MSRIAEAAGAKEPQVSLWFRGIGEASEKSRAIEKLVEQYVDEILAEEQQEQAAKARKTGPSPEVVELCA